MLIDQEFRKHPFAIGSWATRWMMPRAPRCICLLFNAVYIDEFCHFCIRVAEQNNKGSQTEAHINGLNLLLIFIAAAYPISYEPSCFSFFKWGLHHVAGGIAVTRSKHIPSLIYVGFVMMRILNIWDSHMLILYSTCMLHIIIQHHAAIILLPYSCIRHPVAYVTSGAAIIRSRNDIYRTADAKHIISTRSRFT